MTEQQTPAKKSQMAANLAGVGVIVGILGLFLAWRASNLDTTSAGAVLLIAVAVVLLVAALVSHMLRPKN